MPNPYDDEGRNTLDDLLDSSLSALGYVGSLLDKPSRAVRGVLGARPREALSVLPFSDTLGITKPSQRVSGQDLLEQVGGAPESDPYGEGKAGLAGLGVELLTDPLNYLMPGAATTKSGQVLNKNRLLAPKDILTNPESMAAINRLPTGLAGAKAGIDVLGTDVARAKSLLAPEGVVTDLSESALRPNKSSYINDLTEEVMRNNGVPDFQPRLKPKLNEGQIDPFLQPIGDEVRTIRPTTMKEATDSINAGHRLDIGEYAFDNLDGTTTRFSVKDDAPSTRQVNKLDWVPNEVPATPLRQGITVAPTPLDMANWPGIRSIAPDFLKKHYELGGADNPVSKGFRKFETNLLDPALDTTVRTAKRSLPFLKGSELFDSRRTGVGLNPDVQEANLRAHQLGDAMRSKTSFAADQIAQKVLKDPELKAMDQGVLNELFTTAMEKDTTGKGLEARYATPKTTDEFRGQLAKKAALNSPLDATGTQPLFKNRLEQLEAAGQIPNIESVMPKIQEMADAQKAVNAQLLQGKGAVGGNATALTDNIEHSPRQLLPPRKLGENLGGYIKRSISDALTKPQTMRERATAGSLVKKSESELQREAAYRGLEGREGKTLPTAYLNDVYRNQDLTGPGRIDKALEENFIQRHDAATSAQEKASILAEHKQAVTDAAAAGRARLYRHIGGESADTLKNEGGATVAGDIKKATQRAKAGIEFDNPPEGPPQRPKPPGPPPRPLDDDLFGNGPKEKPPTTKVEAANKEFLKGDIYQKYPELKDWPFGEPPPPEVMLRALDHNDLEMFRAYEEQPKKHFLRDYADYMEVSNKGTQKEVAERIRTALKEEIAAKTPPKAGESLAMAGKDYTDKYQLEMDRNIAEGREKDIAYRSAGQQEALAYHDTVKEIRKAGGDPESLSVNLSENAQDYLNLNHAKDWYAYQKTKAGKFESNYKEAAQRFQSQATDHWNDLKKQSDSAFKDVTESGTERAGHMEDVHTAIKGWLERDLAGGFINHEDAITFHKDVARIISKLPLDAVSLLKSGLKDIQWRRSGRELNEEYKRLDRTGANKGYIGGVYFPEDQRLLLDHDNLLDTGKLQEAYYNKNILAKDGGGIYEHEIAHAIDYSEAGGMFGDGILSKTPEWREAHAEILALGDKNPLGSYARNSEAESFAEFFRAAHKLGLGYDQAKELGMVKAADFFRDFREEGLFPIGKERFVRNGEIGDTAPFRGEPIITDISIADPKQAVKNKKDYGNYEGGPLFMAEETPKTPPEPPKGPPPDSFDELPPKPPRKDMLAADYLDSIQKRNFHGKVTTLVKDTPEGKKIVATLKAELGEQGGPVSHETFKEALRASNATFTKDTVKVLNKFLDEYTGIKKMDQQTKALQPLLASAPAYEQKFGKWIGDNAKKAADYAVKSIKATTGLFAIGEAVPDMLERIPRAAMQEVSQGSKEGTHMNLDTFVKRLGVNDKVMTKRILQKAKMGSDPFTLGIPIDAANDMIKTSKGWNTPREVAPIVAAYEHALKTMKEYLTFPFPAFITRNLLSETFNTWRDGAVPSKENWSLAHDYMSGKDLAYKKWMPKEWEKMPPDEIRSNMSSWLHSHGVNDRTALMTGETLHEDVKNIPASGSQYAPKSDYQPKSFFKAPPDYNSAPSGWKLHLSSNDPEAVSKILKDMNYVHKVGRNAGQQGKDLTVYIGSKDAAVKATSEIESKAGHLLKPPIGETLTDDRPFSNNVWGRYEVGGVNKEFHQYGKNGVPFLIHDMDPFQTGFKDPLAKQAAEVKADKYLKQLYGEHYTGSMPQSGTPRPQERGGWLGMGQKSIGNFYDEFRGKGASGQPRSAIDIGVPDSVGKIPVVGKAAKITATGTGKSLDFMQNYIRGMKSVNADADSFVRVAHFFQKLEQGFSPLDAAAAVKKYHIDYSNVTEFEKHVAKNVIPFWTYSSRNLPPLLEDIATKPGLRSVIRATTGNDDNQTPGWVGEGTHIAIPGGEPGHQKFITSLGLPFEDTLFKAGASAASGHLKRAGQQLAGMTSPFLQFPAQEISNTQFWSGKNLSDVKTSPLIDSIGGGIEDITGLDLPLSVASRLGGALPSARFLTAANRLLDPRKGAIGNASNLLSGVNINDIDLAAEKSKSIQHALEDRLKDSGNLRSVSRIYVPEDKKGTLTDTEQYLYDQYRKSESERAKRSAASKKEKAAQDSK